MSSPFIAATRRAKREKLIPDRMPRSSLETTDWSTPEARSKSRWDQPSEVRRRFTAAPSSSHPSWTSGNRRSRASTVHAIRARYARRVAGDVSRPSPRRIALFDAADAHRRGVVHPDGRNVHHPARARALGRRGFGTKCGSNGCGSRTHAGPGRTGAWDGRKFPRRPPLLTPGPRMRATSGNRRSRRPVPGDRASPTRP
jgi:hypothetical protein